MKSINFYAGLQLDRWTERRRDAAWFEARLLDPATRLLAVWRTKNLVIEGDRPQAAFLNAAVLNGQTASAVFLGELAGTPYFAVDFSALDEDAMTPMVNGSGTFVDLRSIGALLDRQQGALLAYARGLCHWHSRHGFCGVCGAPTKSTAGGHVRVCTNPSCATEHFPRTDPAVIMLITDGDRCLLGHHARWAIPMYSTLAGFVEPGESLEDAVAREVREEVGVEIDEIRYHSSQPWPFPSSIMLGFTARAVTTAIRPDPEELADAQWFTRDFLRRTHDPDRFRLPRVDSIARRLIDDWVAEA